LGKLDSTWEAKKKKEKKKVFLLIFNFHIKRNIHVPLFTLGKKTLKSQKIKKLE